MEEKRALKIILVIGLFASLIVNAVVLWENHELRLSREELERDYSDLYASFVELRASSDDLNNTIQGMKVKYSELEASFLGLFDDPLRPPVSKLQAILISFEHGGWNSSNLVGMRVFARLEYMHFWATDDGSGGEVLHEVKEPVSNYSPVVVGDSTYRYVWYVDVDRVGPAHSAPPPGLYIVDAATGEIVSWGLP